MTRSEEILAKCEQSKQDLLFRIDFIFPKNFRQNRRRVESRLRIR